MATDQERNVFGCRTGKGGLRSLRGIFRPRGPACQTRRAAAIFASIGRHAPLPLLQRRREATGLSYFVVFDLANNYVNPGTWAPSLPGDGGPGAADRYLEAFAQSVVRPLTGQ